MLLATLGFIAVMLTAFMFLSKQVMLSMASVIFWAIFGADCFNLSGAAWDIYYLAGFGSLLGMIPLCAFAGYSWRTNKRGQMVEGESDSVEDSEEESDDGDAADDLPDDDIEKTRKPSLRTQALHKRAERRRTGEVAKKAGWGEFK